MGTRPVCFFVSGSPPTACSLNPVLFFADMYLLVVYSYHYLYLLVVETPAVVRTKHPPQNVALTLLYTPVHHTSTMKNIFFTQQQYSSIHFPSPTLMTNPPIASLSPIGYYTYIHNTHIHTQLENKTGAGNGGEGRNHRSQVRVLRQAVPTDCRGRREGAQVELPGRVVTCARVSVGSGRRRR